MFSLVKVLKDLSLWSIDSDTVVKVDGKAASRSLKTEGVRKKYGWLREGEEGMHVAIGSARGRSVSLFSCLKLINGRGEDKENKGRGYSIQVPLVIIFHGLLSVTISFWLASNSWLRYFLFFVPSLCVLLFSLCFCLSFLRFEGYPRIRDDSKSGQIKERKRGKRVTLFFFLFFSLDLPFIPGQ